MSHRAKRGGVGVIAVTRARARVRDDTGFPIEIFPKRELTSRDRLDIIEYNKQLKALRAQVEQCLPPIAPDAVQKTLGEY